MYSAGRGIAGSACGTVIAQYGMAAVYLTVVVHGAHRHGASLRPRAAGIRAFAQAGVPLLVRTLSLRAILLIATAVAARLGDTDIAAHQISLCGACWPSPSTPSPSPVRPSSGAISALRTSKVPVKPATHRMVQGGIAVGVALGVLAVIARPLLLPLFTSDSFVKDAALPALLVVALSQPICGVVFVLDGVLMGAGDGPYLAWAMVVTLGVFTPVALLVPALGGGLTALWGAMTLMMAVRMLTLWLRTRSGRWIVTGATR